MSTNTDSMCVERFRAWRYFVIHNFVAEAHATDKTFKLTGIFEGNISCRELTRKMQSQLLTNRKMQTSPTTQWLKLSKQLKASNSLNCFSQCRRFVYQFRFW